MSPGVSQVWVLQVSQILENQRNFLNGKRVISRKAQANTNVELNRFLEWKCYKRCHMFCFS